MTQARTASFRPDLAGDNALVVRVAVRLAALPSAARAAAVAASEPRRGRRQRAGLQGGGIHAGRGARRSSTTCARAARADSSSRSAAAPIRPPSPVSCTSWSQLALDEIGRDGLRQKLAGYIEAAAPTGNAADAAHLTACCSPPPIRRRENSGAVTRAAAAAVAASHRRAAPRTRRVATHRGYLRARSKRRSAAR